MTPQTPQAYYETTVATLQNIMDGNYSKSDATDQLKKLTALLRHPGGDWLGRENKINYNFFSKMFDENAEEKYGIAPGPVSEQDYIRLLDTSLEEVIGDSRTGARLHHWMQNQALGTTPNLIKTYMQAFVNAQAERARQYIALLDASSDLESHYDITSSDMEITNSRDYLDARISDIRKLSHYRNNDPLTDEILKFASTALRFKGYSAESFADEFDESIKTQLQQIDKKTLGFMQHFFFKNHAPTIPETLHEPLIELFSVLQEGLHYGGAAIEEKKIVLEEMIQSIATLIFLNTDFKKSNYTFTPNQETILQHVQNIFEKWYPGMLLEIEPPHLPETGEGIFLRSVHIPKDSSLQDIIDLGKKPPKERGDENNTGLFKK